MKELEIYLKWKERELSDEDLNRELSAIEGNETEIYERFYKNLEFGTGGLRGIIGAGTNRMNVYTVGAATQGFSDYLKEAFEDPSVAIAYDSRIKSDLFAEVAATVFAANGIKVYLYDRLAPTPMLSFAVRHLKCSGGVVVTASHNPSKYNGYKAYGSDGCQLGLEAAEKVLSYIEKIDVLDGARKISFDEGLKSGAIEYISEEVVEAYYQCVLSRSLSENADKSHMKIVYTPLNGAGNEFVREILGRIGMKDVYVVESQEKPDGNFPTCPYPNPEIKEALLEGLNLAKETDADLLIATDPDCDRVGIAVKNGTDYELLSGNAVGVLLLDYICARRLERGIMPKDPVAVKTIVTTPLTYKVAEAYGVRVIDVLTGFKFIGEQIAILEGKGEEDRFLLGFEESYGYLSGSYVRDKDGVVASMLIAEMAAYYKAKGKTICDVLLDIYNTYGYFKAYQQSFTFEGASGMKKMKAAMESLRNDPPKEIGGKNIMFIKDYENRVKFNLLDGKQKPIELPRSNVIAFDLEGDCSVTIRPSGTEPKIKIYYSVSGKDADDADRLIKEISESFVKLASF